MKNVSFGKTSAMSGDDRELLASLLREEGIDLPETPAIVRRPSSASTPLAFAQRRLWFLNQIEPESPLYNFSFGLRFVGRLEPSVLQRCLEELVRRHEILRTVYSDNEGQPIQVVRNEAAVPLSFVDLSGLSVEARQNAIREKADLQAAATFDLAVGPLLRVCVVRLAETENLLLLALHHIVFDAWSLAIFLKELDRLYAAFAIGQSSPLPELAIQYGDFAQWQHEWLRVTDSPCSWTIGGSS